MSRVLVAVLTAVALCSCSRFTGWIARPAPSGGASGGDVLALDATRLEIEAKLENIVRDHIKSAPSSPDNQRGRLVRRKPYFLREYAVYPDGPDAFDIAMRETESRTAPYVADVKLAKQRFATEMRRKKTDAKADSRFIRGTGTETLTYEFRNGKWRRLGSLFVAKKLEENVNGEWVPHEEAVDRTLAAEQEEQGSWLGRTWTSIVGR
jgi:hypothetical protein